MPTSCAPTPPTRRMPPASAAPTDSTLVPDARARSTAGPEGGDGAGPTIGTDAEPRDDVDTGDGPASAWTPGTRWTTPGSRAASSSPRSWSVWSCAWSSCSRRSGRADADEVIAGLMAGRFAADGFPALLLGPALRRHARGPPRDRRACRSSGGRSGAMRIPNLLLVVANALLVWRIGRYWLTERQASSPGS